MKFKRFLKILEDIIKYHSDICLKTLKIVAEQFYLNLSNTEQEKYAVPYSLIKNSNDFQTNLQQFALDNKIENLQNEIDLLKKSIT